VSHDAPFFYGGTLCGCSGAPSVLKDRAAVPMEAKDTEKRVQRKENERIIDGLPKPRTIYG
jgi:hypothetical protein